MRRPRVASKRGYCPAALRVRTRLDGAVDVQVLNLHSHLLEPMVDRISGPLRSYFRMLIAQGVNDRDIAKKARDVFKNEKYITVAVIRAERTSPIFNYCCSPRYPAACLLSTSLRPMLVLLSNSFLTRYP